MLGCNDPAHQFFEKNDPQVQGDTLVNVDGDQQNYRNQQQQNDQEPQHPPQKKQKMSQPLKQLSSQKQEAKDPGKVVSFSTSSAITTTDIAFDRKAEERSMKKRAREKQRRTDVNKKFSDLTELLQRIHNEENKGDEKATKLFFSSFKANQSGLIAHTICVFERIHNSYKKRKQEVKQLKQDIEQVRKAAEETAARLKEAALPAPGSGSRMMMAPVMMSPDGRTPMIMPQSMQQQPFFPMPHQFASGGAVQHMYSYPTYPMPQQAGNTNNQSSSGGGFMMPSFAPTAATANSHSEADNGTPAGTAPVPTPVAQPSTSSIPSTSTPKTDSSDDGGNLAHCA